MIADYKHNLFIQYNLNKTLLVKGTFTKGSSVSLTEYLALYSSSLALYQLSWLDLTDQQGDQGAGVGGGGGGEGF
jgi:hypothetical protein